jgi:glycosyltransferase involved in cell wall biosynthesis
VLGSDNPTRGGAIIRQGHWGCVFFVSGACAKLWFLLEKIYLSGQAPSGICTGVAGITSAINAPTRLWLASPHFYPTYGGAQNRYRQYIPGFTARGLDVQLLTGTPLPAERSEADAQLGWYEVESGNYLPTTELAGVPLERIRLPDTKSPRRTQIYYDALSEVCSREAPGPVVAQLLTNMRPEAQPWIEKMKESGIATLYSVSQFPAWPSKPTKRWFRGAGYRRVYDSFDALVTNSPAIESFLREIGVTTRIEYIANGVDLARFRPPEGEALQLARLALRARLGIPEDHKVIATIGAVMPRKGPDLAIQAWSRILVDHPNTHLLFIGPRSDKYDPKLARFANRIDHLMSASGAPEQVHFSGLVDDVDNWLRAADLFILPTKREGTPNSVLEAMATGLPAVVTRYIGLSEAIGQPGQEYQLVERNAVDLAGAMDRLLSDPAERARSSAAGLDYVRNHMDQQISLDRYASLYNELGELALSRRHAAPAPQSSMSLTAAPVRTETAKPSMLILGAPPRGGNHLLRGLLDNHPQLLLPPDEDYFIRHLSRHPLLRLRGMMLSGEDAPDFYRRLQKNGHLERVNAGHGTEVFGSENSLDLDAYYAYIRKHHRRSGQDALVRNHVEALAAALGHLPGDARMRVCFCALQPSNRDLTRVSAMLAQSYQVKGIFLVRDPRAHLASKLVRNPTQDLGRFCRRQNRYWQEIEDFMAQYGPGLRLRFEELVTHTETSMRKVCEFAGIEFTDQALDYTQGGEASQSNSSFAASPGIDPSVLTRYQDTMPQATIDFLLEHCRPELFWHGAEEALPEEASA